MRRAAAAAVLLCLALGACSALAEEVADAPVDLTSTPQVDNGVASSHATATDTTTLDRETQAINGKMRSGGEQFAFQAEVNRLMEILIHSLYSNKDIFLRELISNASDALDKIRFLSLTDKSVLGEDADLEIKVTVDKEKNIITIRDKGVGMTKEDLIKNLGTIAKSGTSAFLENMQKGGDINLIGQFGVGFYSVYLVSDYVEVISKHNDDKQHIWASKADGSFAVFEDDGESLGRGTMVRLHLKDEAKEYADEHKLRELVSRYSEFINFPIYLLTTEEVEVPVEEEVKEKEEPAKEGEEAKEGDETKEGEETKEEESEDGAEDDEEEEEAEETKEEAPKKTRREKRDKWQLLNDNKAVWLRKPSEVTEEEYQKFYRAVSKDYQDSLAHSHFRAEGDVEFRAIVYIPENAPHEFYDKYYEKAQHGLKLYVRRVFISDDMTELIPRYLSFVRGIVDSDTLPLNVSREMLQQEAALKTIKKKLVRKVLDLIKKLAEAEVKCNEYKEKKEKGEEVSGEEPSEKECGKYGKFWNTFGKAIKLGVIEDATNRNRLAKLLRFNTSKSLDKLTSLDQYISRMKEGQTQIYYVAGSSQEELAKSPFVEKLLHKGYEVIYFTDVVDEYMMGHLLEYDEKKFQNASKEDLKMAEKDEKLKKKEKALKAEFKPLTKWWKTALGDDKIQKVKVSNRLYSTPCVVVTGKYSQSANMERITRNQAFKSGQGASAQRILEINPRHPLIKALKEKVTASEDDEVAKATAKLMYESALLESGFLLDNPRAFAERVHDSVKLQLGIEGPLTIEEEPEAEEPEDEEDDKPEEVDEDDKEPPRFVETKIEL